MKDKTWGKCAYLVVTQRKSSSLHDYRNAEITVEPVKVRTIGRLYVTLDDPHGTRFNMETRLEDKGWGAKREIYPTREEAEEAAQRTRLLNRMTGYLAFDGQKRCETLSLPHLQVLHDILTQEQPGDVPDTGYISRKSAIEAILGEPPDAHYPDWYADIIKRIPAVDVAPVVHGEWIEGAEHFTNGCYDAECNKCGTYISWNNGNSGDWNSCPHCSAKMDGGNHDV